ncbi:hypothetical protein [Kocuria arenosa]|uniref:hypothetical protein n=1 Tax=Kocuria arenosa TaxID=3071446 RepID=UPI0034D40A82
MHVRFTGRTYLTGPTYSVWHFLSQGCPNAHGGIINIKKTLAVSVLAGALTVTAAAMPASAGEKGGSSYGGRDKPSISKKTTKQYASNEGYIVQNGGNAGSGGSGGNGGSGGDAEAVSAAIIFVGGGINDSDLAATSAPATATGGSGGDGGSGGAGGNAGNTVTLTQDASNTNDVRDYWG